MAHNYTSDFCKHPRATELRQRTDSIGRPTYPYQCLDCGAKTSSAIPAKEALAMARGKMIEPFDGALQEKGRKEEQRLYRERAWRVYEEKNATRRQRYNAYLQTDAWRNKRAQALARDHGVCQGCLQRPATEVHHLTYAHLEDELLFELLSVCGDCHARIHANKVADATDSARPSYDADGNPLNYDEEDEEGI